LQALEGRDQVPLHHLHVVEIVLQVEIVVLHGRGDALVVVRAVDQETGDVAGIDRLKQKLDASIGKARRGVAQIVDQDQFERSALIALWRNTSEAIDLGAAFA
jgi:hypothetical protein